MEALVSFLETLNSLTPLAVIALLGLAIFTMVWKNPFKPLQTTLAEVKDNHLHCLPEIAEDIKKAVEILQRIEIKQAEEFAHLKARVNGHNR